MSAAGADANSGTMPVREGLRFDEDRLAAWLAAHVQGFAGPLAVAQFRGGQSNPTYRLATPGRDYVLRRKPPGPILPGAHAIEREARVMTALGATGFPVAPVLALCEDEGVVGSPFYVMGLVEGRIFWDASLPEVPRGERAAIFDAMNETIARLHAIDPAAVGVADFGRPGNYFARQIARWTKQYLADEAAGRDPGMDRLVEWLPAHIPPGDETAIAHGDFRCDNLIFHATEPRILAVLDWELATLGHPLSDFAYHAMMYRIPPEITAGLGGKDPATIGVPAERDYVAAYCARTGRPPIPDGDWAFYLGFNIFRLAAIFHGIKGRIARGNASSAHAEERVKSYPLLVRLARDTLDV